MVIVMSFIGILMIFAGFMLFYLGKESSETKKEIINEELSLQSNEDKSNGSELKQALQDGELNGYESKPNQLSLENGLEGKNKNSAKEGTGFAIFCMAFGLFVILYSNVSYYSHKKEIKNALYTTKGVYCYVDAFGSKKINAKSEDGWRMDNDYVYNQKLGYKIVESRCSVEF